jgi:hypothetical protein
VGGTWWMVLNLGQDRIVYKSRSCLEAFRVAGRRAGGSARLERDPHFGVAVTGLARTLMVIPVGALPGSADRVSLPVRRTPVVIPIRAFPNAELVELPGGGSFTWIPAGDPWPAPVSPVLVEQGR